MSHVVMWNKPEGWEVKQFPNRQEADAYAAFVQSCMSQGNITTVTEVLVAPLGELAAMWKGNNA